MGHYVYKYVKNNEIVYVGKNDTDLHSRIYQHTLENKFKPFLNCDIYYMELSNSTETRIMESLLINKYKPILNVSEKREGLSLIDFKELEWKKYYKPQKESICNKEKTKPFKPNMKQYKKSVELISIRDDIISFIDFLIHMYRSQDYCVLKEHNNEICFNLKLKFWKDEYLPYLGYGNDNINRYRKSQGISLLKGYYGSANYLMRRTLLRWPSYPDEDENSICKLCFSVDYDDDEKEILEISDFIDYMNLCKESLYGECLEAQNYIDKCKAVGVESTEIVQS